MARVGIVWLRRYLSLLPCGLLPGLPPAATAARRPPGAARVAEGRAGSMMMPLLPKSGIYRPGSRWKPSIMMGLPSDRVCEGDKGDGTCHDVERQA
jgi:hypothetical protein